MKKSLAFKLKDAFYLFMMTAPIVCGIVVKVLTEPYSEGMKISGARIFFTLNTPIQPLPITESQLNSLIVLISVFGLCLFLTHGISADGKSTRQMVCEWIVEKTENLVGENMGDYFGGFVPLIAAVLSLSTLSSLLSLFGLYSPTADLNVVAGWAILVFILITYYKIKTGFFSYIKGFFEPIPVMLPMNILSEVATPISMSLRHYGNIFSGSVIAALVAYALSGLSAAVFRFLPGMLSSVPFLQIGLPAVMSVYFDLFSGCVQAFIFSMLTMLYVSSAFSQEDYYKRLEKKKNRKKKNTKKISEVN